MNANLRGQPHPICKRVRGIAQQGSFCYDKGPATDARNDLARLTASVVRRKSTANDAFLNPYFSRLELLISSQTGQLGAGAGATGRTVVRAARTQDKVAAIRTGIHRRAKKFDVVDLRATLSTDSVALKRLRNRHGRAG